MPTYLITAESKYKVVATTKLIAEAAVIGMANGMDHRALERQLGCTINPRGTDIVCTTKEPEAT